MVKVIFICCRDTTHNGKKYLKGQALDEGDPYPSVGPFWLIRHGEEPLDGFGIGRDFFDRQARACI